MRLWTILMATVAATAMTTSLAMAQDTQEQRREMQGASDQSSSAVEHGTRQERGHIRDVTPSKRPEPRSTTGQAPASSDSNDANRASENTSREKMPPDRQRANDKNSTDNRQGTNDRNSADKGATARTRSSQDSSQEPGNSRQRSGQNLQSNHPASSRNERSESNRGSARSSRPSHTEARGSRQAPPLSSQQETRFASVINRQKVEPVTRVNFALNVGVRVPSHVHLMPVPTEIVGIVPQYRGYSFFVTSDRIVIVEPRTHEIVHVMSYEGRSHVASTSTRHRAGLDLTKEQREVVRRSALPVRRATTGSTVHREVTIEEEVPSSVELEEFDEPVVRDIPSFRRYRYYRDNDDVVVVDPDSRHVIDVIR
jgi:urease beta subunit